MIEKRDRNQILVSDVHADVTLYSSIKISIIKSIIIYNLLKSSDAASEVKDQPCWRHIPKASGELSSVMSGVLPLLYYQSIYEKLQARSYLGKFQAFIGYTYSSGNDCLFDD